MPDGALIESAGSVSIMAATVASLNAEDEDVRALASLLVDRT
jgi:hypothetical protein